MDQACLPDITSSSSLFPSTASPQCLNVQTLLVCGQKIIPIIKPHSAFSPELLVIYTDYSCFRSGNWVRKNVSEMHRQGLRLFVQPNIWYFKFSMKNKTILKTALLKKMLGSLMEHVEVSGDSTGWKITNGKWSCSESTINSTSGALPSPQCQVLQPNPVCKNANQLEASWTIQHNRNQTTILNECKDVQVRWIGYAELPLSVQKCVG